MCPRRPLLWDPAHFRAVAEARKSAAAAAAPSPRGRLPTDKHLLAKLSDSSPWGRRAQTGSQGSPSPVGNGSRRSLRVEAKKAPGLVPAPPGRLRSPPLSRSLILSRRASRGDARAEEACPPPAERGHCAFRASGADPRGGASDPSGRKLRGIPASGGQRGGGWMAPPWQLPRLS